MSNSKNSLIKWKPTCWHSFWRWNGLVFRDLLRSIHSSPFYSLKACLWTSTVVVEVLRENKGVKILISLRLRFWSKLFSKAYDKSFKTKWKPHPEIQKSINITKNYLAKLYDSTFRMSSFSIISIVYVDISNYQKKLALIVCLFF